MRAVYHAAHAGLTLLHSDIDLELLEYLQTFTVAERLALNDATQELVLALRNAGAQFYGFDPHQVASAVDSEHDAGAEVRADVHGDSAVTGRER